MGLFLALLHLNMDSYSLKEYISDNKEVMMRKAVTKFARMIPSLNHDEEILIKRTLESVSDYQKVRELIESKQDTKRECPFCHSNRVYRHGLVSNLQRYRCVECKKTFNSLTNTPLSRLRKKELWIQYVDSMLKSTVLRTVSDELGISLNTAFKWRHRFSAAFVKNSPTHLEGIVEMDETYFLHSKKGERVTTRVSRKRGESVSKADILTKKVCVFTARDRSNHNMESIADSRHVSEAWLIKNIAQLIAPDSVIVSNGLSQYQNLSKMHNFEHKIAKKHNGNRAQAAFHIKHVNAYHSRLKMWINGHFHGVATKYLNNYLDWRQELERNHPKNSEQLLFLATNTIPQLKRT